MEAIQVVIEGKRKLGKKKRSDIVKEVRFCVLPDGAAASLHSFSWGSEPLQGVAALGICEYVVTRVFVILHQEEDTYLSAHSLQIHMMAKYIVREERILGVSESIVAFGKAIEGYPPTSNPVHG